MPKRARQDLYTTFPMTPASTIRSRSPQKWARRKAVLCSNDSFAGNVIRHERRLKRTKDSSTEQGSGSGLSTQHCLLFPRFFALLHPLDEQHPVRPRIFGENRELLPRGGVTDFCHYLAGATQVEAGRVRPYL